MIDHNYSNGRIIQGVGTHLGMEKYLTFRKSTIYSSLLAWLYGLVLAGYPLLANFSVYLDLQGRLVGMASKGMILLLSIVMILWIGVIRGRLYLGLATIPLFVFWILFLGRIFVDTIVDPANLSNPPFEYFVFAVGACLIPMVAFMVRPSAYALERAFNLTYALAVLAGSLLLLNMLFVRSDASYWSVMGRLGAETVNPITIGHLGATIVILSGMKFLTSSSSARSSSDRYIAFTTLFIGLVALVLSASKGPVLALLVALVLFAVINIPKRSNTLRSIAVATVLLLGTTLGAVMLASYLGSSMLHRVEMLVQGYDAGTNTRLNLLSEAWEMFLRYPLSGGGLELQGYGSYPHNVVVESFMTTGILGGVAFTCVLFFSLAQAVRLTYYSPHHAWVALVYIQYMVGALVSGALAYSTIMWSMIGAVFGLSYVVRQERYRRREGQEILFNG